MRSIVRIAALAAGLVCATAASAQPFPSKPIRIVVPWPPGGVTDVLTRTVAAQLGEQLGQQVLVENRPGAGGTIGVGAVAKAPADGYTLVMTDVPSHAISATLYPKLPYDVVKDFDPIALVAGSPMVLVTQPALNAKTMTEFLQLVRSKPGQLSYASSGNGSITHLGMERMKRMAGIDLVHVPFKGTVPAITSVLSADTAMAFGTIPGVVPHAKSGKLVLLGVSFARRFPQLPDIPPLADQVPGFDMGFYTALFAPARTPREAIDRLHTETMRALEQPKVKETFAASAAESGRMTPAELAAYLASEVKDWGEVVRAIGLKVD
jgi:tripartite-type tricarboxylate transporter receptor subunit TctC